MAPPAYVPPGYGQQATQGMPPVPPVPAGAVPPTPPAYGQPPQPRYGEMAPTAPGQPPYGQYAPPQPGAPQAAPYGQAPYGAPGQTPYGASPPQPYRAAPPVGVKTGLGSAIASVLLGGLLTLFSLAEILGSFSHRVIWIWIVILPIALGSGALRQSRLAGSRAGMVRALAITGIVLGAVGGVLMLAAYF